MTEDEIREMAREAARKLPDLSGESVATVAALLRSVVEESA